MSSYPRSDSSLQVYLNSVGLCAPGLANWTEGCAVLTGQTAYQETAIPRFECLPLPRNEARRTTFSIRLALRAAQEALQNSGLSAPECRSVFACSGGNPEALDGVFAALTASERLVSPNFFINSVHSAPAGYWSIATGSFAPWTSLSAYDASFVAGLLEAASLAVMERCQVLLVAYDVPPPLALWPYRPIRGPFSAALQLSGNPRSHSRCCLKLKIVSRQPENTLADVHLELLRANNPAGRSLPLLKLIAEGRTGRVVLPYLGDTQLLVRHAPC